MYLEEYFDFLSEDDIRIKGHRIGIDDVLTYYRDGYSAEEIVAELPSLTLEEVYATITYYLHNRLQMDGYLARLNSWRELRFRDATSQPSALRKRLQTVRQMQASSEAVFA